jgi:hypothetical protein
MQSETPQGPQKELKIFIPVKSIKEIRAECRQCKGKPKAIMLCKETTCANHPYRLTPMQAHRARYLTCEEGLKWIRLCENKECSTHPFRFGTRPKLPTGTCDNSRI